MDRLDAMQVFVAALDEGSLAGAARRLRRSPAAITRAIAMLERHVGVPLLQRTTRAMRLTEAGAPYAATCRRVLADLEESRLAAAGQQAIPRGSLTITAPVLFGTRILRPVVSGFLAAHPDIQVRYVLLDRPVNLVDEGIDAALRIAHLPDSNLVALRVGEVRRILCAAPSYLAVAPGLQGPADLAHHACIGASQLGQGDVWSFPPLPRRAAPRNVAVTLRLSVNAVQPALDAAIAGEGVIRVLSYQVAGDIQAGRLVRLLPNDEPQPLPVHLIVPEGRLASAKVRAFIDFAASRLRTALAALGLERPVPP